MNQLLKKKGDITIFLIVAVIALFLFFFLFVLFQNQSDVEVIKKNSLELSTYGQKVKMYVEQCLYDSAVPAVYYVGLTGGYIDPPPETFRSTKATIAYYYYFDADKMPSKGKVQNEISKYIEETLFICIRNFQGFPGVDIDSGVMHADTLIGENDVTIHLEYPVTIKQGSSSMTVKDFQTLIPIRLGKNYGYAKEVNEETKEEETKVE